MHLGKYLLENRIVTAEQLEEALQLQVGCGGRLGTNLVELGHLSVEELGRHLAQHTGLPLPPSGWVESPEPEALKAVPLALVRRYKVLPMRIEARTLHLAMLDPLDPPDMDEIAFATGLRIKPYVLPEVAVFFWLDQHLGIPREIRYIDLGGRDGSPRSAEPEARSADGGRDAHVELRSAAAQAMAALGVQPLATDEELVDEHTFSELQTAMFRASSDPAVQGDAASEQLGESPARDVRPASQLLHAGRASRREAAPGPAAPSLAELEGALARAPTREAVAEASLRIARTYVPAAALFVVHRGMIAGVRASGGRLDRRIRALMIPTNAESFLAVGAGTGEPLRAGPPKDGIDARLLDALGRANVKQVAVLPIKIRERVVNLLYVDNGPDAIADTTLAALQSLCECTSAAYERLILERKRRIG